MVKANRVDDRSEFDELKQSLKSIGFNRRTCSQIFQLLSVILHIGNLQFVESGSQEACTIKFPDDLNLISEFLGVTPDALLQSFIYKTKSISGEMCSVYLNADQAFEEKDIFAKTLYDLLFQFILNHIIYFIHIIAIFILAKDFFRDS